jgi:DNA-binding CsgD family transcriptional regulator
MVSSPVFCRRFIGREAELALLIERWRDAVNGTGAIVLVAGEAGIGKTRFIEEARNALEAQGARFAFSQCWPLACSPLAPIVDVLRALNDGSPHALDAAPQLRNALARILPELEQTEGSQPAAEDRRGQYVAIGDAFRHFGAAAPAIVVIEDIHWSDLASLEFLAYAAERVARWNLVLVVTYRSDELRLHHPLATALSKLGRHGAWRVEMRPLSEIEMAAFAACVLEGRKPLAPQRIREALAIAEGSPLFAEELLRQCVETDDDGAPELPLSLRAAVLERVATLPSQDRAVLSYAAAIGRRFDARTLAELTGRSVDAIESVLRTARDLQVVRPLREIEGTYVFRHAVIQESLYQELLPSEARPLHESIARKLETLEVTDERTIELAHHWWAARHADEAARYNAAAGDIATRRLAHHDAVRFYERALEFAGDGTEAQAVLYEKLGMALSAADPGERPVYALRRALEYYERSGDHERAAKILLYLSRQYFYSLADPEQARRVGERALATSAARPERPLHFLALANLMRHYALLGDVENAERYEELASRFRGDRSAQGGAQFLMYRAVLHTLRGCIGEAHDDFQRAIAIAADVSDPETLPLAWHNYGVSMKNVGYVEDAVHALETSVRISRERFLVNREAFSTLCLGETASVRGDLREARRLLLEAHARVVETPAIHTWFAYLAVLLGIALDDAVLIERFGREEIVEFVFRSGESQRIEPIAVAFAGLARARGEPERAAALLHRAACVVKCLHFNPSLAVAVARMGRAEDVPRMRDLLGRWASSDDNRVAHAYLQLFDALTRPGDDASRARARKAAQTFRELHLRPYEAIAEEAAGNQHEALALYRAMGNVPETRRLEAQEVPRNRVGRAKNELTRREREIAELVAQGRSNRAIAEALVLSERTVETHVASILAKLDLDSRAEVAAFVARTSDRAPTSSARRGDPSTSSG